VTPVCALLAGVQGGAGAVPPRSGRGRAPGNGRRPGEEHGRSRPSAPKVPFAARCHVDATAHGITVLRHAAGGGRRAACGAPCRATHCVTVCADCARERGGAGAGRSHARRGALFGAVLAGAGPAAGAAGECVGPTAGEAGRGRAGDAERPGSKVLGRAGSQAPGGGDSRRAVADSAYGWGGLCCSACHAWCSRLAASQPRGARDARGAQERRGRCDD
jgi:hypothetical protein